MKVKKGIGPVVALSLLIVVSVVSVVGFQTWFSTYQSNIFLKAESTNSVSVDLNFIETNGTVTNLYYYNPSSYYLRIDSIKINKIDCTLLNSDVISENELTKIDVSGCDVNGSVKSEVVLITPKGTFSKYVNVNR